MAFQRSSLEIQTHPGLTIRRERISTGSSYNSRDRRTPSSYQGSAHKDILAKISEWADGDDDRAIFWLHGPAGSGKSTIAHTIAERYDADKRLVASFFFSRGKARRSDVSNLFSTLNYQLAKFGPSGNSPLLRVPQDNPSTLFRPLGDRFSNLISNRINFSNRSLVVIVDGLDECEEEDWATLFRVLACADLERPLPIRFLLTSRAGGHIEKSVELYSSKIFSLNLADFRPEDSLDRRSKKSIEPENSLDSLYKQTLADAPHSSTDLFRRVIGAIRLLLVPLSTNELARLLRVDDAGIVLEALQGCRSILNIPDDDNKAIQFVHASMQDFFTDEQRSKKYFINPIEHQTFILDDCVKIMTAEFELLLDGFDDGNSWFKDGDNSGPSAFSYACQRWYHHMALVADVDGGIDHINVYFGTSLISFLTNIKSKWFTFWIGGVEDKPGFFEDAGEVIFKLVTIIKELPKQPKELFNVLYEILECLEVCFITQ